MFKEKIKWTQRTFFVLLFGFLILCLMISNLAFRMNRVEREQKKAKGELK
jgi:preprotein translocase subunit SecG